MNSLLEVIRKSKSNNKNTIDNTSDSSYSNNNELKVTFIIQLSTDELNLT